IRAFTPWPGVWTIISLIKGRKDTSDGGEATTSTPPRWRDQNNRRLKILKVHLASQGETLQGKLILDLVQLEGKNPVSWKQFKEGYPNFTF
ncbi:hypothetical protein HZB96_01235, partial [Candidatus Gottesmanbacteria bacterium]|nr:hypothetical protein [Candidatus Gottesmanbacteria bacterium]